MSEQIAFDLNLDDFNFVTAQRETKPYSVPAFITCKTITSSGNPVLNVKFSHIACRELKIDVGSQVVVGQSKSNPEYFALKVVEAGGYAVTSNNKGDKKATRFARIPNLPVFTEQVEIKKKDIEINGNVLVFRMGVPGGKKLDS